MLQILPPRILKGHLTSARCCDSENRATCLWMRKSLLTPCNGSRQLSNRTVRKGNPETLGEGKKGSKLEETGRHSRG